MKVVEDSRRCFYEQSNYFYEPNAPRLFFYYLTEKEKSECVAGDFSVLVVASCSVQVEIMAGAEQRSWPCCVNSELKLNEKIRPFC